jgi:hypothetical protein
MPKRKDRIMITEIGALVSIIKNLIDVTKAGSSFLNRSSQNQEQAISKLQGRMEGLVEQLSRCMQLDRLIPVWERRLDEFRPFVQRTTIEAGEAQRIEHDLRDLIKGAAKDYFSGAFFYTEYEIIPGVHAAITEFRTVIENIDHEISHIPPNAWRSHWPQLAGRLRDLQNATAKVERSLEDNLAKLFKELRDASRVKAA